MKKGISVIVCSYNSGHCLQETLRCLKEQYASERFDWELIFVDNAGREDIIEFVKSEWKSTIPLKILREPAKGKYFAFQKGISAAEYCYFIVCDDDNFLHYDYLLNAYDLMESNGEIGAIGGLAIPKFENEASVPKWFDSVKEHYAIGPQNLFNGLVNSRHLWGAGLCSRTEIYRLLYKDHASFLIDKNEELKLIAEDTEYCLRLQLMGMKLFYSDTLVLQHYVTSGRLTEQYVERLHYIRKVSFPTLEKYYIYLKVSDASFVDKVRLCLISPFRYLLSFNKVKKRRQALILQCLLFPLFINDSQLAIIFEISKTRYLIDHG